MKGCKTVKFRKVVCVVYMETNVDKLYQPNVKKRFAELIPPVKIPSLTHRITVTKYAIKLLYSSNLEVKP